MSSLNISALKSELLGPEIPYKKRSLRVLKPYALAHALVKDSSFCFSSDVRWQKQAMQCNYWRSGYCPNIVGIIEGYSLIWKNFDEFSFNYELNYCLNLSV